MTNEIYELEAYLSSLNGQRRRAQTTPANGLDTCFRKATLASLDAEIDSIRASLYELRSDKYPNLPVATS